MSHVKGVIVVLFQFTVWSYRCMQFFTELQRKFNSIKNSVHENNWIRPSIPICFTKFCLTIPLELDTL